MAKTKNMYFNKIRDQMEKIFYIGDKSKLANFQTGHI